MSMSSSKDIRIGRRVLGKVDDWTEYFKGVITKINDDGTYEISFDDGEICKKVKTEEIKIDICEVAYMKGQRVQAKLDGWDSYFSGVIVDDPVLGNGTYHVVFDDGDDIPFVPWDMMRKERPKVHKPGTKVKAKIPSWKEYYPGVITLSNLNATYQIKFEDGETQDNVEHDYVIPIEENSSSDGNIKYEVGENIMAKVSGWDNYYKGIVSEVNKDNTYRVDFEDGDMIPNVKASEMIKPSNTNDDKKPKDANTNKSSETPAKATFAVNDRVLATIPEWDEFYPGRIKKVHPNNTYDVAFDDGDMKNKIPASSIKIDPAKAKAASSSTTQWNPKFKINQAVSAQLEGWDRPYNGEITEINQDTTYCVTFEDGEVVESVEERHLSEPVTEKSKPNESQQKDAKSNKEMSKDNDISKSSEGANNPTSAKPNETIPASDDRPLKPDTKTPKTQAENTGDPIRRFPKSQAAVENLETSADEGPDSKNPNASKFKVHKADKNRDKEQDVTQSNEPEKEAAQNASRFKVHKAAEEGTDKSGAKSPKETVEKSEKVTEDKAPKSSRFKVQKAPALSEDNEKVDTGSKDAKTQDEKEVSKKTQPNSSRFKVQKVSTEDNDQKDTNAQDEKEATKKTPPNSSRFKVQKASTEDIDQKDTNTQDEKEATKKTPPNSSRFKVQKAPTEDNDQNDSKAQDEKVATKKTPPNSSRFKVQKAPTETNDNQKDSSAQVEKETSTKKTPPNSSRFKVQKTPTEENDDENDANAQDQEETATKKTPPNSSRFKVQKAPTKESNQKNAPSGDPNSPDSQKATKMKTPPNSSRFNVPDASEREADHKNSPREKETLEDSTETNKKAQPNSSRIKAQATGKPRAISNKEEQDEDDILEKPIVKTKKTPPNSSRSEADKREGIPNEDEIVDVPSTPKKDKTRSKQSKTASNYAETSQKSRKSVSDDDDHSSEKNAKDQITPRGKEAKPLKSTQHIDNADIATNILGVRLRGLMRNRSRKRTGVLDTDTGVKAFHQYAQRNVVDLKGFTSALVDIGIVDVDDAAAAKLMCLIGGDSSKISMDQLKMYIEKIPPQQEAIENKLRKILLSGRSTQQAFRDADTDGSNSVSPKELCTVYKNATGESLDIKIAKAIVKLFDTNGDDQLDETEFIHFVVPEFGIYVMTPVGQFYLQVDPTFPLSKMKAIVLKRVTKILGNVAVSGKRSLKLRFSRHFGKIPLEPPMYKSSVSCLEALTSGETVYVEFVDFIEGSDEFRYMPASMMSELASTDTLDGNTALKRLKTAFEHIDTGSVGYVTKEAFVKGIQTIPQVKSALRGTPEFEMLLSNPKIALKRLDSEPSITFEALSQLLLPISNNNKPTNDNNSLNGETKSQTSSRSRRSSTQRLGKTIMEKTGGLPEMSTRLEESVGYNRVLNMSKEARSRLLSKTDKPIEDMKLGTKHERDPITGASYMGSAPEETQQWVNSRSSKTWLGLRPGQNNYKQPPTLLESYSKNFGLPKNPSNWMPKDVEVWVTKILELPQYKRCFKDIGGNGLLKIESDEELRNLGMTEEETSILKVGVHRKKILAHIKQLRNEKTLLRKTLTSKPKPEDWSVVDVQLWLVDDLGIPKEIAKQFQKQSVDGCLLQTISYNDMTKAIGIHDEIIIDLILTEKKKLFPKDKLTYLDIQKRNNMESTFSNTRESLENTAMDLRDLADALGDTNLQEIKTVEDVFLKLGIEDAQAAREVLQGIQSINAQASQRKTSKLDELMLRDIQSEIERTVTIPRGSGSQGVRALRESHHRQPKTYRLKAIESGIACKKFIEAQFHRYTLAPGVVIPKWFPTPTSKLSVDDFLEQLEHTFPDVEIPPEPVERMWQQTMGLSVRDDVSLEVLVDVFINHKVVGSRNIPETTIGNSTAHSQSATHSTTTSTQQMLEERYIKTLEYAISQLQYLQFSGASSTDEAIAAICKRVQNARAKLGAKFSAPQMSKQVQHLEATYDQMLLNC